MRLFTLLSMFLLATNAHAILITGTTNSNDLANAVLGLGSGITTTATSLSANTDGGAVSSGTYTNATGTYGIGDGIVLSSGNANEYNDGPNLSPSNSWNYDTDATTAQEALLDPISGGSFDHRDVTQFDIEFDVNAFTDTIFFDVVFGSEEFDEFVDSDFIDAFGIYLNGVNIALFDGLPININHPSMGFISGTELNGVIDPLGIGQVMAFSGGVTPGSTSNTLSFILADTTDDSYDTTVYISGFSDVPPIPVPEPATLALFGIGLAGLGFARKKKKSA